MEGSEFLSWDSNPLLVPTGEKPLFGSITAPEFIISENTPDIHLNLDTLLDENIYDQSAFNSTDLHEALKFSDQVEQWSAGLQSHVDYDTTRTSELTTFGLDLAGVRHFGASLSPEIAFSPTSVDKFSLIGTAAMARYDNSAFTDYDLFTISPTYSHNFNPLNTGTLSLEGQRYQTASGPGQATDSLGPALGWISALTPTLKVQLEAGVQKSEQSGNISTSSDSNWDYIFSADLGYTGEQDTTHLVASRSQYPFANGTETLLTSFAATEVHTLNPDFALNLAGSYQLADDIPVSGINLDYQASASVGLTYHLYEHLDVTSSYQYKDESLTNVSSTIRENVVMFGLTYHPAMKAL
jgi:hypothetical protein